MMSPLCSGSRFALGLPAAIGLVPARRGSPPWADGEGREERGTRGAQGPLGERHGPRWG